MLLLGLRKLTREAVAGYLFYNMGGRADIK